MLNKNKMSNSSDNADLQFINSMIEHHLGAIEMANEAIAKSNRAEIIDLSNNIITAQTNEIEMMYAWKKDWFNDVSKVEINSQDHSMSMTQDLGAADANFDLRFIDAMTEHHNGAVDMANDIKLKSKRSEILNLADTIIKDQTSEIELMSNWRNQWYPNDTLGN